MKTAKQITSLLLAVALAFSLAASCFAGDTALTRQEAAEMLVQAADDYHRGVKTEDILKGYQLCRDISRETGIPITYTTCVEKLVPELEKAKAEQGLDDMVIYPIKLYMRPTWLDRK